MTGLRIDLLWEWPDGERVNIEMEEGERAALQAVICRLCEIRDEGRERILKSSVERLGRSLRLSNCLQYAGLHTIGDVIKFSERQLLRIKNFGRKSACELRDILHGLGLHLEPDSKEPTEARAIDEMWRQYKQGAQLTTVEALAAIL